MARRSVKFLTEDKPSRSSATPRINLTLKQGQQGQMVVGVSIGEFIAYAQNVGFTRLNLTGGKVLEVKETTDQIDRLVRAASSQQSPLRPEPISTFNQAFSSPAHSDSGGADNLELQPEFPSLTQPAAKSFSSLMTEAR